MDRQPPLGALFVSAARRFEADITAHLREAGFRDINPPHAAVFGYLDADGTRPSELARRAGVTRQSMAELVADLERKGYVRRETREGDVRARHVVLTERGRLLSDASRSAIEAIEEEATARLGADRLVELRRALHDLSP